MSEPGTPLSSFPTRPFAVDELSGLTESGRFLATIYDEVTLEVEGPHLLASNCVFVTEDSVSAAVYVEDEEIWYRVYSRSRGEAVLTAAYDAVREVHEDDDLFSRQPLTVSEAVYAEDIPTGTETSGYEAGDDFDCPVCDDVHTVQFDEDEVMTEYEQDTSVLFVDCPAASRGRLYVEMQASTPGRGRA